MIKRLTIAIDGPAGAGKSTVARGVAERLGYTYVDTGAMYRAVALQSLRLGISPKDEEGMAALLDETSIVYRTGKTLLNGEDVSEDIRTPQVTALVSGVARIPLVRAFLVECQRRMGAEGGVVMDGRDVGTVILPEAELKIFLTASLQERARRRQLEWLARGAEVTWEEVEQEIGVRDKMDRERKVGPLRIADDAVVIDSTELDVNEVVDQIVQLALAIKGEETP
ncbi:MAG: (d)CMP kinase [Limnochordia bacterium]|jgi:cytidylate kinase|nr:(d)CMP kinase [Bacillota bacterium]